MNLPPRNSRKSILVVDDDEGTREAIYRALSPQYRVILAVDGLDGYEKANEPPPPDLIIADIAMPGLDGLKMALRIRENDALRLVPIVLVAGHMPPERVLAESHADPFSWLPRTDLDVLERAMKRLLN
jgi:CheY-like chemotaxis protein